MCIKYNKWLFFYLFFQNQTKKIKMKDEETPTKLNVAKKYTGKLTAKAMIAANNAINALKNDKGDGHFVAILSVIIIVVVLAVAFQTNMSGLMDTGMNKTSSMVNGLFGG